MNTIRPDVLVRRSLPWWRCSFTCRRIVLTTNFPDPGRHVIELLHRRRYSMFDLRSFSYKMCFNTYAFTSVLVCEKRFFFNQRAACGPKHLSCSPQQSFNKTCNIFWNRLRSAIKQNVSIDLCHKFVVRFSNKILGLDLALFSEKVENYCLKCLNGSLLTRTKI